MKRIKMIYYLSLFLLPFVLSSYTIADASAQTIFVNQNSSGSSDGTSWPNAFNLLQDALAASSGGDQIWVAAGIYKPDQGTNVTVGDRSASFVIKNGVALYGGFAGNETAISERDLQVNKSILSGDLNGNDTPGFVNNDENSYHVLIGSRTDATAILDGFTISNGNANIEVPPDYVGGGMYNYFGSPTLNNCTFTNNTAKYGGGLYNDYRASPTLTNSIFTNNTATLKGGGIRNFYYSSTILNNCTLTNNTAKYGGGLANKINSSSTITSSIFWGNIAQDIGPQIFQEMGSIILISYCDIDGADSMIYNTEGSSIVLYDNNINAEPMFDDNLHLQPLSPCIDAGDPASTLAYDIDNEERPQGAAADMGADEFSYIVLDTEAPTIPQNLGATLVSYTSVELTWEASTDNVGVSGYNIFRNDTSIGTTQNLSFTDTGIDPQNSYIYTITAFDASGNNSDDAVVNIFPDITGSLILTGNLTSAWHYINGTIITLGTTVINSGVDLDLVSGATVTFLPGFQVVEGGNLRAVASPDTDGDQIFDIVEQRSGCQNPNLPDTDGDGLSDSEEDTNKNGIHELALNETSPCSSDTDGDKMDDGWEVTYDLDPLVNDADDDPDGDNLTNYMEYYFNDSDPNDGNSLPPKGTFYEYDELGRIKKIIRIK